MEEERVKAEMREKLAELMMLNDILPVEVPATCHYDLADQILSIKGIRIESDDQGLPKSPYSYYSKCDRTPKEERDSYCDIGYSRAVEDMLKAGFIKCERREDGS